MSTRTFKKWADHAAPANLLGYLFGKDRIQQSLRLILAGAQGLELNQGCLENDYIAMLKHHCPSLYNHYVPLYERVVKASANPPLINTRTYATDERHTEIHTWAAVCHLDQSTLNPQLKKEVMQLPRLSIQHIFHLRLRNAYANDYGIRNLVSFGKNNLRWRSHIAFNDK